MPCKNVQKKGRESQSCNNKFDSIIIKEEREREREGENVQSLFQCFKLEVKNNKKVQREVEREGGEEKY